MTLLALLNTRKALLKGVCNCNNHNEKIIKYVQKHKFAGRSASATATKTRKRSKNWNERYLELCEFKSKHGNCVVRRGSEAKLSRWVTNQRQHYAMIKRGVNSPLNNERIKLLENIGFVWNCNVHAWDSRLKQLIKYHQDHGHCNVPRNHEDQDLFQWVLVQRQHYRQRKEESQSEMTLDRISRLEDIGFKWSYREHQWNTKLKEFSDYQKSTGLSHVPSIYEKNPKLASWAKIQRLEYLRLLRGNESKLVQKPHRKELLDSLNFQYVSSRTKNVMNKPWQEYFKLLQHYLQIHSTNINSTTSNATNIDLIQDLGLKTWLKVQLRQYTLYKREDQDKPSSTALTSDQIQSLESINISSIPPYHYDQMFCKLTKFKIQYGSSYVPLTFNLQLYSWQKLISHKYYHYTNNLRCSSTSSSSLLINEIHALKHYFAVSQSKEWYSMLYQCEEYLAKAVKAAKHNSFQITEQRSYYELLEWIQKQTVLYNRSPGTFSKEQIRMLEDIGLITVAVPGHKNKNKSNQQKCSNVVVAPKEDDTDSTTTIIRKKDDNIEAIANLATATTADRKTVAALTETICQLTVDLATANASIVAVLDTPTPDLIVSKDNNLMYNVATTNMESDNNNKQNATTTATPKIDENTYWEKMCTQLQEYAQVQQQHSTTTTINNNSKAQAEIPIIKTKCPQLTTWESEQREEYKLYNQQQQQGLKTTSKLTLYRIQKLQKTGFIWDIDDEIWMRKYRELVDYTKKAGHCFVPHWYPTNPSLGHWVHVQLRQLDLWNKRGSKNTTTVEDNNNMEEDDNDANNKKKEDVSSKLTKERVTLLEEVGLLT